MRRNSAVSCGLLPTLALVVLGLFWAQGGLEPQFTPDSASYLEFDWSSPRAALTSVRTVGYPLFVALVRGVGGERAIPFAQWAAYALGVGVFAWGLWQAGYRGFPVVCAAGALLFGRGLFEFASLVMPDTLAMSFAIAAAGCFCAVIANGGRHPWAWLGLMTCSACAYQVRPAYLFLIPLWPVLGWLLDAALVRRTARWTAHLQRAGWLAVATIAPYVVFCGLRWSMVGHAGLVSFGGYNIVGIAGQAIDEPLLSELSADVQPLARQIVQRRRPPGVPSDYAAMVAGFNPVIWEVAVPAAKELYDDDTLRINHAFGRLSREVLQRRPAFYAQWLRGNAVIAFANLLQLTLMDYGTLLLGLLCGLRLAWRLGAGPSPPASDTAADVAQRHLETHLLLWTAVGFAAAKTLLVLLVEPAGPRYMTPAMSLLPAVLAVWFAQALGGSTGTLKSVEATASIPPAKNE